MRLSVSILSSHDALSYRIAIQFDCAQFTSNDAGVFYHRATHRFTDFEPSHINTKSIACHVSCSAMVNSITIRPANLLSPVRVFSSNSVSNFCTYARLALHIL